MAPASKPAPVLRERNAAYQVELNKCSCLSTECLRRVWRVVVIAPGSETVWISSAVPPTAGLRASTPGIQPEQPETGSKRTVGYTTSSPTLNLRCSARQRDSSCFQSSDEGLEWFLFDHPRKAPLRGQELVSSGKSRVVDPKSSPPQMWRAEPKGKLWRPFSRIPQPRLLYTV